MYLTPVFPVFDRIKPMKIEVFLSGAAPNELTVQDWA
jgi:hypothetical protein